MKATLAMRTAARRAASAFLAALGLGALAAACVNSPGPASGSGSQTAAPVGRASPAGAEAVLVRGWIGQTGLELEPVLVTTAAPSERPGGTGSYRLRGFDDAGALSFEFGFDADATARVPGRPGHHFMVVVALEGSALDLARVELDAGDGRELVRSARLSAAALVAALSGDESLSIETGAGRVVLRWDAARFPLLQLRDPAEGAVLALVRDGELRLDTEAETLELAVSEGVRSAAALIRLR